MDRRFSLLVSPEPITPKYDARIQVVIGSDRLRFETMRDDRCRHWEHHRRLVDDSDHISRAGRLNRREEGPARRFKTKLAGQNAVCDMYG